MGLFGMPDVLNAPKNGGIGIRRGKRPKMVGLAFWLYNMQVILEDHEFPQVL
jgi:hypothetical protein